MMIKVSGTLHPTWSSVNQKSEGKSGEKKCALPLIRTDLIAYASLVTTLKPHHYSVIPPSDVLKKHSFVSLPSTSAGEIIPSLLIHFAP